jgi:diguanylate cyclase (GGDEF)-like protein
VIRFDLPTVIAYAGVMSCMMGLILGFIGRDRTASITGLNFWAAATLVAGLGTLTRILLRNFTSDAVAIGAQNVCLILTAALFLAGTCEFFDRPLPRRFLWLLVAVAAAAMVVFASYEQGPIHRRMFARSVLVALYGYHAWVIHRQERTFARYLTLGSLLMLLLLISARAVVGYFLPESDGVDSIEIMQVVYAVGFSSADVLIPICAILMTHENIRLMLEDMAMRDSLTGALNRRALFQLGGSALAGCQRRGQPLSVLLLDLDHFKQINDLQGHHVGDLVLKHFADRVQGILRRPAMLARYGGDEFVVVLPGTTPEDAEQVAERIRNDSVALPEVSVCHVSIGVASSVQGQLETLAALIQRADKGLYLAKNAGRNRIETVGA